MRGPMQGLGAGPLCAVVLCKTPAGGPTDRWSIKKEWDMVECRYNVLVLDLSTFDNIRWLEEIHYSFKWDNCLLSMRFIIRFYNSRVRAVSGKNEQPAQTAWRGAQCNCIGCIGLRPALAIASMIAKFSPCNLTHVRLDCRLIWSNLSQNINKHTKTGLAWLPEPSLS